MMSNPSLHITLCILPITINKIGGGKLVRTTLFSILCKYVSRAEVLSQALIAAKETETKCIDINIMSCYFFHLPATPMGVRISTADAEVKNLMVDNALSLKRLLLENLFKLKTISLRNDLMQANKKNIIATSKNVLLVSTCLPHNIRSGLNADFLDQQGAYSIVCITIQSNHDSSCKIPEDSNGLVDSTFLSNFFPKRFFEVPGIEVVDGFWSNSGLVAEASSLLGIKFLREEMSVTITLTNQARSTRRVFIDTSMKDSTPCF